MKHSVLLSRSHTTFSQGRESRVTWKKKKKKVDSCLFIQGAAFSLLILLLFLMPDVVTCALRSQFLPETGYLKRQLQPKLCDS